MTQHDSESNTRDIGVGRRQRVTPAGATRYGLVVGIETYREKRLNLRCARADARAMYDLMIDPAVGMFPAKNVQLLLDENATKQEIWNALAKLRRSAGRNDSVWIYYSGHGAAEGDDAYWVTHDADIDDLYATALCARHIQQVLGDIKAERLVTFLDCCHAAATTMQANPTKDAGCAAKALEAFKGKGKITFSSSDGHEKSVELPEFGHGAFTYFLSRGLRGEADTANEGVVTAEKLWQYLDARVSDASQRAGNPQTPRFTCDMSHGLALTLNPTVLSDSEWLARAVEQRVGPGDACLGTEEAAFCLDMLRGPDRTEDQQGLIDDIKELANASMTVPIFRRLLRPVQARTRQVEDKERDDRRHAERRAAEELESAERTARERDEAEEKARAATVAQLQLELTTAKQVTESEVALIAPQSQEQDLMSVRELKESELELALQIQEQDFVSAEERQRISARPQAVSLFIHQAAEREAARLAAEERKRAERVAQEPAVAERVIVARARASRSYTADLGAGVKMQFVRIEPGEFLMGSPTGEEYRSDDEFQHKVRLTRAFMFGIHPVTRGQFAAFVNEAAFKTEAEKEGWAYAYTGEKWDKVQGASFRKPGFEQRDDHPVVCVSWNDATAFSQWLSRKGNRRFRLPTEAEWEYACRARTTTPFHTGATINTDQANYDGNHTYGQGIKGVYRKATTPVGFFKPNEWGLFDMHGNAWEWCADGYGEYPRRDVADPAGDRANSSRVLRGGSWSRGPRHCRAAYRGGSAPGSRSSGGIGFRVSLDL